MRRLGRTGHKDANQDAIVEALRWAGASVLVLSGVGYGCPDLLVGYDGYDFLMEIKSKGGLLTKKEAEFARTWKGKPVHLIYAADAALRAIGAPVPRPENRATRDGERCPCGAVGPHDEDD